jgi:glucose-6-phosphate isomerase (EC 5.3.1.9)
MYLDIGNVLNTSPGITEQTLDRLDDRVAIAHDRIEEGREAEEHGYAALNLPQTVDTDEIRSALEPFGTPEAVLTVGIGGSALGAATISDALADQTDVEAHFLDNVDPEDTAALLDSLPLDETVLNVVSRSGTTAETLANFLVVREAMEDAGVDWTEQTFVTTGDEGNLRNLADKHDLPSLRVPDGVPGRFSALSTVGLACGALQGIDIEGVVEGARSEMDKLSGSLEDSPGYA